MNRPWNETNPEWWKMQVETRGDLAWIWLVNEWAGRECVTRDCAEPVSHIITTSGGRRAFCETHGRWYVDKGSDIYPVEPIVAKMVANPG